MPYCVHPRVAADNLIQDGMLSVIALFVNSAQSWLLFDPNSPDAVNTLDELCTNDILWLNVTAGGQWLQQ
jgi:hypothetical protein